MEEKIYQELNGHIGLNRFHAIDKASNNLNLDFSVVARVYSKWRKWYMQQKSTVPIVIRKSVSWNKSMENTLLKIRRTTESTYKIRKKFIEETGIQVTTKDIEWKVKELIGDRRIARSKKI